ncbi:MAG: PIN domain-containing protein [Paracoccaceae bacterium]
MKSQKVAENLARVESLKFETLPFSKKDGKTVGRIRADLQNKGTPIRPYDILIAGQAVSRSLILITNNIKEFARVETLQWEDWV